jgi:hypothetical protein
MRPSPGVIAESVGVAVARVPQALRTTSRTEAMNNLMTWITIGAGAAFEGIGGGGIRAKSVASHR